MDTTTVLEIIKKLDSHIKAIAEEYKDVDTDPDPKPSCPACKSQDPDHLCML